MRVPVIAVTALAVTTALTWATMGASGAAGGSGVYADWTVSGTSTSANLTGTVFPAVSGTRTGGSWQVAAGGSTWLSADTPFGQEYGSSRDKPYLFTTLPLGGTSTSVTLTFDTAPTAGTWGFALGDIDAEDITITATGTDGQALDVSAWFQSAFNACTVSPKPSACPAGTHVDQPTWSSPILRGSANDTNGATAWFKPTAAVKTITFLQARNVAGAPVYQLWIASDVISALSTASPSASASVSTAEVCTEDTTALVNGGFERPAIPAKSYRQLLESDVPGWETTASDKKIEIWSTGFNGVDAPVGDQFAELNATQSSELFQAVDTTPGQTLTWSLLHRARAAGASGDTMSVNIGAPSETPNATYTFTDTLSEGWVRHTGEYTVPEGQVRTRFGFESGPTASGNKSIGNFLDDIYFTTTACLPEKAAEGNVVEPSPVASQQSSPSPTASPSVSASPSASPSGSPTDAVSASPSASASASPTASASSSSTESATASPSPSATASPSGSTSPSPSASATSSASPSPTASPSASPTATASTKDPEPEPTRTPVPVKPDTPTVIDVITSSGSDPDSTITQVDQPRNGTVEIKDNTVIYTPDPGFIGRDLITTYIKDPAGDVTVVRTSVTTGLEQKPVAPLGLPSSIAPNRTVTLIDHTVRTNADQNARVTAECVALTRMAPAGGFSGCVVTRDGAKVMVTVTGATPYRVVVTLTAPAKGDYLRYVETRSYTVRP